MFRSILFLDFTLLDCNIQVEPTFILARGLSGKELISWKVEKVKLPDALGIEKVYWRQDIFKTLGIGGTLSILVYEFL
jgi:hypothetical protein